jgi:hypothetical protein
MDNRMRRRRRRSPGVNADALAGWLPGRGELEHVVGALHANAFRVLSSDSQAPERPGVGA